VQQSTTLERSGDSHRVAVWADGVAARMPTAEGQHVLLERS